MSTKNKTKNLKLPQYQNDDLFDMKEVNEAYKIIDESYKEQNDNYKQAIETSTINGAIDNLELIDARKGKRTLGEKISEIDEELDNIKNKNFRTIDLLDIGCREEYNATQNRELLENKINEFSDYYINIVVNENREFEFGDLKIDRSNVTINGGGTLRNTRIILVNDTLRENIKIENIRFWFSSLTDGNNAITMQRLIRSQIINCKFYNCDKAISYTSLDSPQHVSRITISNNYFHNINFAVYGVRTGNQPLIVADIHITNNMIEYCLDTHLWLEGFDGGVISDNTMFFPSYMLNPKCMTKRYNIYIDYCNWTIIKGNNLFEAGLSSIVLSHSQCVNLNSNNIAWSGQIEPRFAIEFINGDNGNTNSIYNISTVSSNIVSKPSGGAIKIDNKCGYINVTGNMFQGSGNREFYYGKETSPSSLTIQSKGKKCIISNNVMEGYLSCECNAENKTIYSNNVDTTSTKKSTFNTITHSGISLSTLNAENVDGFVLNLTGSTITDITGGYEGKELALYFYSPYVTIDATNIVIKERTATLFPSGTTLFLKYFYGKWHEVGRDR